MSHILNLLNLVVYSQYTAVHTSMFMVDESEPTDYNICQNLWRNVLRNATEHRHDLYCIVVKLVKKLIILFYPKTLRTVFVSMYQDSRVD